MNKEPAVRPVCPPQAAGESYADFYKRRHKFELANGDICQKCSAWNFQSHGILWTCPSCHALDTDKGEVESATFVRCPKCKHLHNVNDCDFVYIYQEGTNSLTCLKCEHEFDVETMITYLFESPALD
jgi:hypothetical protein